MRLFVSFSKLTVVLHLDKQNNAKENQSTSCRIVFFWKLSLIATVFEQ